RFGSGDDTTLSDMQRGTLEAASLEQPHWPTVLTHAVKKRLRRLSNELRQRLDLAIAVGDVSAVLGWTRAQVTTLYCFSRIPAFPTAVHQWIDRTCRGCSSRPSVD